MAQRILAVALSAAVVAIGGCGTESNVAENNIAGESGGQSPTPTETTAHSKAPPLPPQGSGPRTTVAGDGAPAYETRHANIQAWIDRAAAAPGETVNLTIRVEPAEGWHVYPRADKPPEGMISRPTLIVFDELAGLRAERPTTSSEVLEKEGILPGEVTRYHAGSVNWTVAIGLPQELKPGPYRVSGLVGLQTCADDDSECDRPAAARFVVTLPVAAEGKSGMITATFSQAKYLDAQDAVEASSGQKE